MTCQSCGGLVTWRGPLTDLTHTKCERCGAINNQVPEDEPADDREDDGDNAWFHDMDMGDR